MGFFDKLKSGLEKTKNAFFGQLNSMFRAFVKVDEDFLEELEDMLISADVGVETSEEIISELREKAKDDRLKSGEDVKNALRDILREKIGDGEALKLTTSPSVILVIGVNGVGKTTTIGKISARLADEGKKVVIAAADTFRAAAIDQLEVWCERSGAELIKQSEGSDPAAVVFDAAAAARKRRADVLIVDTAGRLHNKKNLMDELAKIDRVLSRELPDADRETLLVLDSTTGQNAVMQAAEFKNSADITGLVLTKLDGTAKGGAIFSIKGTLGIPVKFIGVGEGVDDLQPFDADMFVSALLD
jgi:fused signal recognition particle receptor